MPGARGLRFSLRLPFPAFPAAPLRKFAPEAGDDGGSGQGVVSEKSSLLRIRETAMSVSNDLVSVIGSEVGEEKMQVVPTEEDNDGGEEKKASKDGDDDSLSPGIIP